MASILTRNAQHQKGRRIIAVAFAVWAFSVLPIIAVYSTGHASSPPLANIHTGTLPESLPTHEINFTKSRMGAEGLELNARLVKRGGLIKRPIHWTVREYSLGGNGTGEVVFSGSAPLADVVLAPGGYEVEAHYGHAIAHRFVEVLPGTRTAMTLILNVGGVRALARVAGVDATVYGPAVHKIVSLDENTKQRVVAKSVSQGQIVRLSAGNYRIESTFTNGNAVASSTVTVKPGILTSVEIKHHAALARLTIDTPEKKKVNWQIRSLKGAWKKSGTSFKTNVVLAPGGYVFSANVAGKTLTRTVKLEAGKATVIYLTD